MKRKYFIIALILILIVALAGCADVTPIDKCVVDQPYGFWSGLWHGLILTFSFIGSLISDDIAVYAVNNTGGWYDFGFLLGAGGFSITFVSTTKRKKRK